MSNTPSCFICASTTKELRLRTFQVLYYIMEELICKECLELPTDEFSSPWEEIPEQTPPTK